MGFASASKKLPGKWIVAIYLATLVPYAGPPAVILLSSILYYAWRRSKPTAAKQLNRHAWLAWGIAMALSAVIRFRHIFFS
jgi:hypothetical protein